MAGQANAAEMKLANILGIITATEIMDVGLSLSHVFPQFLKGTVRNEQPMEIYRCEMVQKEQPSGDETNFTLPIFVMLLQLAFLQ